MVDGKHIVSKTFFLSLIEKIVIKAVSKILHTSSKKKSNWTKKKSKIRTIRMEKKKCYPILSVHLDLILKYINYGFN